MPYTKDRAFQLLEQARNNARLPHALLLSGPLEAGAKSLCLRLIDSLNGGVTRGVELEDIQHPMCQVIRPASKSRRILIRDIREVEPFLALRAEPGQHKIIIILEADRMNDEAANAFLKTLEEPPSQSLIILVTEHIDHLLPTILSRCIRMELREEQQQLRLSEVQKLFLPKLDEALQSLGSDLAAMALRQAFQSLLASRKELITKRLSLALKEESKGIAEGTGVKDWESSHKDSLIALIESEYLNEREELLELLSLSLGQAVLIASKAPNMQHEPLLPVIAHIAANCAPFELIERMRAVDALRHDLLFNINEALALDAHLLDIIGQR